jgi:hypothetical protein
MHPFLEVADTSLDGHFNLETCCDIVHPAGVENAST